MPDPGIPTGAGAHPRSARRRAVLVTGTGTGVGKTVTTAALAATARAAGRAVTVVKLAQTGVGVKDPGDAWEVARLAGADSRREDASGMDGSRENPQPENPPRENPPGGNPPWRNAPRERPPRENTPGPTPPLEVLELLRLPDPLAPDTAARRAGVALPPVATHAERIADLSATRDVVLVEGSGGLMVHLDAEGGTLAHLGRHLVQSGVRVDVVVVVAPGLGTLNHTALTLEALSSRRLPVLGIVVGAWPARPDLAARCNLDDLAGLAGDPLFGVIPEGAGRLEPEAFFAAAPSWWSTSGVAGFLG